MQGVTSLIPPTYSEYIFLVDCSTPLRINIQHSQNESSEMFIGEWMETRGIRDQMVIATKVSLRRTFFGQ